MGSLPLRTVVQLSYHRDTVNPLIYHWFLFTAVISGLTSFHRLHGELFVE
jgi:hypothetical protein